jgi:hypothetical protein
LIERRTISSRLENWAKMYQRMRNTPQADERRAFGMADALLLDRAMPQLSTMQRSLLWWCYVKQDSADDVCTILGLARKPALQFIEAVRVAEATVEALVERETLPLNS